MRRAAIWLGLLAACGDDAPAMPDAQVATCDVLDCAELETCVWVDDATGYGCVDFCEEAGVTEEPSCLDGAVATCEVQDGHHVVVNEACGVGAVCMDGGCVADPCAGIGPLGKCAGDTLIECVDGAAAPTDCAQAGEVCAFVDEATGYACVAAGSVGASVVTGVVSYEDRAPDPSGSLMGISPVPARGAQVSVILDSSSAVLASAVLADDGSYTLRYDATDGDLVHVLVTAQSTLPTRPVRVRRNGTQLHGFGGASFAAAASATSDVLITDASGSCEAFNILDQAIVGMDMIASVFGGTPPPLLTVRWSRGSNQGSYYDANTITLLGASSDNDGYDDTVILHEFGHYLEDVIGRSDNPGGSHDGSPDDPRLAWSEGFSTYLALALRGDPVYTDSNSSGGWAWNGDEELTVTPDPTGSVDQDVSEDMVAEALWDMGDGGAGDDDVMTGGTHGPVLRVQSYLRDAALRPVGVDGVDLVDGLDAWFVQNGLATCAPVRGVVTGVRGFPYDYAGPGGTCP